MRRLFLPFGGLEWPQRTHLVLDEANTTLKVARGDSFTLSVKVRPGDKVPEAAKATYRFADGAETVEPLRTLEGGEFRGRIESVNQPFQFTVTAGDDSHVDPRRGGPGRPAAGLKSLAVRMVSPQYTGLPVQTLAPGLTQFRALEGTRLELEAEASKPLTHAELRIGDDPAGGALAFDALADPVQDVDPGQGELHLLVRNAGHRGLPQPRGGPLRRARLQDEAPRVVIEEPKTDRDVPADATVPVRDRPRRRFRPALLAPDLPPRHRRVGAARRGRRSPSGRPKDESSAPAAASVVKHQEIAYDWELAPLKLAVGTVITFYADARDFDTHQGPERRQEPRAPPADRLQGRRGPPVRRRPPRASRGAGPRPHHAEASHDAGRERRPRPSRRPTGSPKPSATTSTTPR